MMVSDGWSEPEGLATDVSLERILRRAEFTEGRSFAAIDGSRWFLPVLTEGHWDQFPSVRDFFEGYSEPSTMSVEIGTWLAIRVLDDLLGANYHLDRNQVQWLTQGIAGAVLETMRTLDDVAELFMVFRFADAQGQDRRDTVALNKFFPGFEWPLLGWCEHDGCLFQN